MNNKTPANVLNPFQPLWIPQGRFLLRLANFKQITRSGIELDQLDTANRMVTAEVIAISPDAIGKGVEVGDFVVTYDMTGIVWRPDRHSSKSDPKKPFNFIQGMDVYMKWNCNPQDYYDYISSLDVPETSDAIALGPVVLDISAKVGMSFDKDGTSSDISLDTRPGFAPDNQDL